jgi:hypothetical protein
MGKRAVFAVSGLFVGITLVATTLLSIMLSRPMGSGKTGWDMIAAAGSHKYERSLSMSLFTVGTPRSARGCATILPNEQIIVPITVLGPSETGGNTTYYTVSWGTPPTQANGEISTYNGPDNPPFSYPFETTIPVFQTPSQTATLYLYTFAGDGVTVVDAYSFTVVIDTTTKPSFPSFLYDVDDCAPLTFTARITINRADSWSYRLLDNHGLEMSGGTPNSPDTSGCSFQVVVSDITGAPQIEITATNPNGSTTQAFTLAVPGEATASLSADPISIPAGGTAVLNWSVTGTYFAEIDCGIGGVFEHHAAGTTEGSGFVEVSPTETTTYTLTAQGACNTATASATVTVTVPEIPMIHNLTPNPRPGRVWCLRPGP